MAFDQDKNVEGLGVNSPEVPAFLVPQATLQPPEYFIGTNNNINEVIAIGGWELIAGETIRAIDKSGNFIHVVTKTESIVNPPGSKTVLEKALTLKKSYIGLGSSEGLNRSVIAFLTELEFEGFPELTNETQEVIVNRIKTHCRQHGVGIDAHSCITIDNAKRLLGLVSDEQKLPLKLFQIDDKEALIYAEDGNASELITDQEFKKWSENDAKKLETYNHKSSTANGLVVKSYVKGNARIMDINDKQLLLLPDRRPIVDKEDENNIWYIDSGKLSKLDGERVAAGDYQPNQVELPEEIGNCLAVEMDPNGNFLAITHETDSGKKISFLDKKSLSIVEEIEDVNKPPVVDEDGNVVFIDTNNQLRMVVTNFSKFPKGYGAHIAEIQQRRMEEFKAKIANLERPEIDQEDLRSSSSMSKDSEVDEATMALQAKLKELFDPEIAEANTEEELRQTRLELQAIIGKAEYQPYASAASSIERAIEVKTATLLSGKLETGITALESQIPIVNSLEGSLSLVKELEKINDVRSRTNFLLLDPERAKAMQSQISSLESRVAEIQSGYQGELITGLKSKIPEVEEILKSASSLMELEEARRDPLLRSFQERLKLITNADERKVIREQWNKAIEARQSEIEKTLSAREQAQILRAAEVAAEIEGTFKRLDRSIEGILKETGGTINLMAWKEGSPTVAEVREQIENLPLAYRTTYQNRIEEILLTKQREYQQRQAVKKKELEARPASVRFGEEEFPVFQAPLMTVTPGWIPISGSQTSKNDRGQLVFQSSTGEVWKTGEVMIMNMNEDKRKNQYENLKREAELRFNPRRHVPDIPDDLTISPSQERTLEKMSKLFRQQLGMDTNLVRIRKPKGITIIQGDAGAGKDFSIESFAAMTNREVVSVPCRFSMDPEDITSEYRFDPRRGTFRVPSQFAQALTKSGTIVNFIEINTMPPEVSKMLNSVFDFKRTLYFTQGSDPNSVEINDLGIGQEIKVNNDVVFVGTMNPENYIGTRPLPQEFKSRARFMDVDYPPYRVAKNSQGEIERLPVEQTSTPSGYSEMKISPDEAMILAKQVPSLKSLTADEFMLLWDHKINKEAGNGADILDTAERGKPIEDINLVVKIANKMRQAYRAFQTNEPGADVFEFVFSIRESQDIVTELTEANSVKEAIKEVVLPKIADPEQRKRALDIIQTS